MNKTIKAVSLFYKEGSSDKAYNIQLVETADGHVVNFQYGRRGSTLKPGTKTKAPTTLAAATAVFDKIELEKRSDGYTDSEGGTPFQNSAIEERVSGYIPQLLNFTSEDSLEYLLKNETHLCQQKHDGERRLIRKSKGAVEGIVRRGLTVALPQAIADAAMALKGDFVLDGEIMGDKFVAFDIIELNNEDLKSLPYATRLATLYQMLGAPAGPPDHSHADDDLFFVARSAEVWAGEATPQPIECVRSAVTPADKARLFEAMKEQNTEGVVFKLATAPYAPGRPASGGSMLKFKFWASASVEIGGFKEGMRSALMRVYNRDGVPQDIGYVTIPANVKMESLQVGDIIEVRHQKNKDYVKNGGSLFLPVFLSKRTDLQKSDCSLAQFGSDVRESELAPA